MNYTSLKNENILETDAEAFVNTVNCKGIMGKGLALAVKKKYPQNFDFYRELCEKDRLHPGDVIEFPTGMFLGPSYIINFATKDHWKGKSKLVYISIGLVNLIQKVNELKLESIAIPPLGCGYGGLDWSVVKPMIVNAFQDIPIKLYIYEPH